MDKKHCYGCRNDFYNGKNPYGVEECWSRKKAKMVTRIGIGHWESPPYKNKTKRQVPDCWHGEGSNRTHFIDPASLTADGFWR